MKFFFPIHLNSGNRGCEAIAKGTALILQEDRQHLVGLCTDVDLDTRLGVEKCVTLIPSRRLSFFFRLRFKLFRFFVRNEDARKKKLYEYTYRPFIDRMGKDDILVSTGGDMMCYGNNEVNYTVNLAAQRGIKSILWGCSLGEENLTKEKLGALNNFSLIYARDPLTKAVLERHHIDNVMVYPDPAFILEPEACDLPEPFLKKEVIGVNLSNYVLGGFDLNTSFAKEVIVLLDYIIAQTDYHILLIPHVFWQGQDDRLMCRAIKDKFSTKRISILEGEKLNYCQIRFVISKCKMLIASRTHAVISAYATCVPALALGYSIKSKGIASFVGMPDWSVVDSREAMEGDLFSSFLQMIEKEDDIRRLLQNNMPQLQAQLLSLPEKVQSLLPKNA